MGVAVVLLVELGLARLPRGRGVPSVGVGGSWPGDDGPAASPRQLSMCGHHRDVVCVMNEPQMPLKRTVPT